MNTPSDRQWMMPDNDSKPIMRMVRDEFVADGAMDDSDWQPTDGDQVLVEELQSSMKLNADRRRHRRFHIEARDIPLQRWDGRPDAAVLGKIVDLSAGGVRLRTRQTGIRVDQQIRVRLELPDNGGISPFVDMSSGSAKPKREWIGWLAVARVQNLGDQTEVAGRLVDMEEMDRGMLSLYLSTQPLAA